MVLCGVSTLVPLTPGGAGTQQVMIAFALSEAAAASIVLSFSIGMQAGITAVNALLGLVAAMVAFRTLHRWPPSARGSASRAPALTERVRALRRTTGRSGRPARMTASPRAAKVGGRCTQSSRS